MSNIFKILTLKCKDASVLLTRMQDEPLSKSDRLALKFHVMICKPCRRFKKQLELIKRVMSVFKSNLTKLAQLTDKQRERIRKKVLSKL